MTENIEQPKLHGWITVEYAKQLMVEIINFLEEHDEEARRQIREAERGLCLYTIMNAPHAVQN